MPRCVNIDWLEVYCKEPAALTPDYFRGEGFEVSVRDYGSPQYRQMFTLLDSQGRGFLEVRRDPYSIKSQGGIFPLGACHLRLTNRQCYIAHPIAWLLDFIAAHNYELISTSRLDLALDFAHFDCNQNPARFLRDYFANKYAKINQAKFQAHGTDAWEEKTFNSVKWGSEFSKITTKLYNKSMELARDGHDKVWIRQAWKAADLPDDRDIWRIEFSMKSECKSLVRAAEVSEVDVETGELCTAIGDHRIDISLWNLLDKTDIVSLFFALLDHYFDFRYVEYQDNGKPRRKDRCRRVPLFRLNAIEQGYTFKRLDIQPMPGRREKMMMKYLKEIASDRETWGRDAEIAANNLRNVFIARYAFARTLQPIEEIYLNPDKQPQIVIRHDQMNDQQFEEWKKAQREMYDRAITNFIRRSPDYWRIRQRITEELRNRALEEDLPF